ncbi:Isoleucine--tRNA ligase [Leucoagaricus sp. SymC.cos]|nr:Isoleucine--tRNA ligase [Leucoagaricus sp. SymC.cos]
MPSCRSRSNTHHTYIAMEFYHGLMALIIGLSKCTRAVRGGPGPAVPDYPFDILTSRRRHGHFRSINIDFFCAYLGLAGMHVPCLYDRHVIREVTRKRLRRKDSPFKGEVEFVEAVVYPEHSDNAGASDWKTAGLRIVVEIGDGYGHPAPLFRSEEFLPSGHRINYDSIRLFDPDYDGSAVVMASIDLYHHWSKFHDSSSSSSDNSSAETDSNKYIWSTAKFTFCEFIILANTLTLLLHRNENGQRLTTENSHWFANMIIQALALHTGADLQEYKEEKVQGGLNRVKGKKKKTPVLVKGGAVDRGSPEEPLKVESDTGIDNLEKANDTCLLHNVPVPDPKAYSKSLLLPKTSFPLWTNPYKGEEPFRRRTTEELYRWQWKNKPGRLFVFHDGPPYANGDLHMGHALNKITKDVINRSQMMLGRKIHYIPGWDCHGLPIENKALQELGKDSRSVGPTLVRKVANATALREVDSQKKQFLSLSVMADWHSDEWTYRTLDHKYEMYQLGLFQKMVELGYIFRHYRPVHYSPSSRSALAEAELVYKDDHVSRSVFVTFDLKHIANANQSDSEGVAKLQALLNKDEPVKLLVWTTTPWTLTANMGIAVNPELHYVVVRAADGVFVVARERLEALGDMIGDVKVLFELMGSDLVDGSYQPIFSSLVDQTHMKIIPASHVTSESGTGLVHCAPAHGAEDYHAFHGLSLLPNPESVICHVDEEGKFTGGVIDVLGHDPATAVQGKEVLGDGSKAIVDILRTMGRLVKIQRIKHRYPYDWKTDKPIIVTATSQWFANLDAIKQEASNALDQVSFWPPQSENRLKSFIQSRSEWCVSRQRSWGVPIPAIHHIATDQAYLDQDTLNYILPILEKKGVAYWWTGPVEEFLPPKLVAMSSDTSSLSEQWRKATDTMDVWFDSGSSWTLLKGVQELDEDTRPFLADVCLEGSDQHRGWFQSQLLTKCGSEVLNPKKRISSPYKHLITHGMVLDEKGKKMSKSLGNIVSPMIIIHGGKDKKKDPAYGADLLRLWAATVEYENDMSIGPKVLSQTAEKLRKIRNTTRFILGNLSDGKVFEKTERAGRKELGLIEKYVMHELYSLQQLFLDCNDIDRPNNPVAFEFSRVMTALVYFANITLSSFYFDIRKDTLYAESINSLERRGVLTVLEKILDTMTAIYSPVLPHLAEEVHANRYPGTETSYFMSHWKPLSDEWHDPRSKTQMTTLLKVRDQVLSLLENARTDKHIKSSLEAGVDIIISQDLIPKGNLDLEEVTHVESFLKSLFITSDAQISTPNALEAKSEPEWEYTASIEVIAQGNPEAKIQIRVRPAMGHKCPRCWTFARADAYNLCKRCEDVMESDKFLHEHVYTQA